MDAELKAYLDDMKRELRADFRADLEKMEINLLRAFHDQDSPVEMRARSRSAVLRALDIEIESLGDRLTKLEKPAR